MALTIAGSDSGGGAGIQADLRTFFAHGLLGTSVITAVTAQNTVGVQAVAPMTAAMVAAQLESVLSDLPVAVIKIGMLADAAIVRAVVEALRHVPDLPVVLDPVILSSSGTALLDSEGVSELIGSLLPLATVVTPNHAEAARLAGATGDAMWQALAMLTPATWVLTGGEDGADDATDIVRTPDGELHTLMGPRHHTKTTHGTGCTFASAVAAGLARDVGTLDAVKAAKAYVSGAIKAATEVGAGKSPLDHLWRLRRTN
ncbi:MAG: hydroxymethylpyrimidine/phosphomethylpyrimidine kinase [Myxococcota bacterium]